MRKWLFILVCLTGCAIQHTMERTNDLMAQNMQVIEENTRQIKRSTDTMMEFQIVFPILFGIILVAILYIISRFIFRAVRKRRSPK
jgi:hypothetical protein